jgi:hypothetical protein
MSAPEGKTDAPREPGHFRFWTLNGHPNWSAEVAEIKISARSMQE